MRLGIVAVAVTIAACNPPSQHNESVYGVVKVAFGPSLDGVTDWRSDQQPYLAAEVQRLSALGPTFTMTSEGSADVVVRTFDSGPGCAHGAGQYTQGSAFAEVDPACCAGYNELQQAVGHEIIHWTTDHRYHWLGHVCQQVGDAPDCHHSIFGEAVLNPALGNFSDTGPTLDEVWAPTSGDGTPTTADLELFARCQTSGCP